MVSLAQFFSLLTQALRWAGRSCARQALRPSQWCLRGRGSSAHFPSVRFPHLLSYQLAQRTFRTFDFYKKHQEAMTPAVLAFFQCRWDDSVTHIFHQLLGKGRVG